MIGSPGTRARRPPLWEDSQAIGACAAHRVCLGKGYDGLDRSHMDMGTPGDRVRCKRGGLGCVIATAAPGRPPGRRFCCCRAPRWRPLRRVEGGPVWRWGGGWAPLACGLRPPLCSLCCCSCHRAWQRKAASPTTRGRPKGLSQRYVCVRLSLWRLAVMRMGLLSMPAGCGMDFACTVQRLMVFF